MYQPLNDVTTVVVFEATDEDDVVEFDALDVDVVDIAVIVVAE